MNGPTHVVIGIAAGAALALALSTTEGEAVMMVVASMMTAKTPDIDLNLGIAHRGLTHSLLALGAVYVLGAMVFPQFIMLALVAGYGSHILADMITNRGVMLLYPLPYRLGLNLMSTGSYREAMLRYLVVGIIAFLAYQWIQ